MSDSTYTFTEKSGNFQFTVKSEFLKIVPNPAEFDHMILCAEKNLPAFLHNPVGPATVPLFEKGKDNSEYWINGEQVSGEEEEKLKKLYQFNSKLTEFIKE